MILVLVILYVVGVVVVSLILYYKKLISGATARNIIHLFSGLSIISLYFADNKYFLLILSLLFTLLLFCSRKKTPILNKLFNAIVEKEEKRLGYLEGPTVYALAISILILFSIITKNNVIPLVSTLVLVLSDPIASIIGKKYGKLKIGKRTAEGFFAMFISTLIIILIFYNFSMNVILISLSIAIVELISPSKMDDITVPASTALLLLLL